MNRTSKILMAFVVLLGVSTVWFGVSYLNTRADLDAAYEQLDSVLQDYGTCVDNHGKILAKLQELQPLVEGVVQQVDSCRYNLGELTDITDQCVTDLTICVDMLSKQP